MNEYSQKMTTIQSPRGYMTIIEEIDDTMMSKVISNNGQVGWLGSNGRPDVAAGHSIIAASAKTRALS